MLQSVLCRDLNCFVELPLSISYRGVAQGKPAPKIRFTEVPANNCDKPSLWRCVLQGGMDWVPHNHAAVQLMLAAVVLIFFKKIFECF